jgi:hypothetical protein
VGKRGVFPSAAKPRIKTFEQLTVSIQIKTPIRPSCCPNRSSADPNQTTSDWRILFRYTRGPRLLSSSRFVEKSSRGLFRPRGAPLMEGVTASPTPANGEGSLRPGVPQPRPIGGGSSIARCSGGGATAGARRS